MWDDNSTAGNPAPDVNVTSGTLSTETGSASASASPAPSSSSASPAAKTVFRGKDRRKRGSTLRVPRPTAHFKSEVAVLRSQGLSRKTTGRVLNVSETTILNTERLPDVQQRILELRSVWKNAAHTAITSVATDAWQMANDTVAQRDAKSFDATMRGLYAMEKISSSLSGEGQKVELTTVGDAPKIELKLLLANLFKSDDHKPE